MAHRPRPNRSRLPFEPSLESPHIPPIRGAAPACRVPLLRTAACAFLLLGALAGPLAAQFPNIRVSELGSTDPEEVTIAINPAFPGNLAAGANLNYTYASYDGGLTWVEDYIGSNEHGVWGDPCVAYDIDGNLYYGHLSNPPAGDWIDRIVVQRSENGGLDWTDGAGIGLNPPKDQDKEWLAADWTDSPWRNNLYVSWTEFDAYGSGSSLDSTRILFSRSTDRGDTWSAPIRLSDRGGDCRDDDNTVEGAVPAVGPNGEVYAAWASPDGIYFDRSTDGGLTFGDDIFVADQPGGWAFDIPGISRCNGLPITDCDISPSAHRGNVYVTWSDQRNGTDDTDVFFARSTDGGDTWSAPLRVNDDEGAAQQFFPWMTVDPVTGVIYVVFYDRRDTGGLATEVWMARSKDGGRTFSNFRVSESAFTAVPFVFFGDYIDITAYDGRVYPIWMRMDNEDLSVWTALIEEPLLVHDDPTLTPGPPRSFDLAQNYPNPFNPVTTITYRLPNPGRVTLAVYDVKGRRVDTLVDDLRPAGEHTVTWRADGLGSGIYLYRLQAEGAALTRKCLLSK